MFPATSRTPRERDVPRMMASGRSNQDIADALVLSLGTVEEASRQAVPSARPLGLAGRELDVLRLLVAGRSNREIAEALFISPRTAQTHVQHIFDKLDVDSRAGAVAYALQHVLV